MRQNASFIAQGLGRMTGKAGVCLVTSGPGTTNLVTGFATATSEGSPVVGFGGVVPRADRLKQAHQSLDTATLLRGVSKYSVEVDREPHSPVRAYWSVYELTHRTPGARRAAGLRSTRTYARIYWHTFFTCGEPQWYGKPLKRLRLCLVRRELLVPAASTRPDGHRLGPPSVADMQI